MTIKMGGHGREEAATTTMGAIKKATESNQLRLQTLELAVAHLTNICIGLSEDVRSILLESNRNRIRGEDKEAVIEMKLPYYSNSNSSSLCSDSKDDLGAKRVKRQPWNKDAKAIPLIKVQGRKSQAITVKANPKAAAKTSQKGSTKAGFVKNTAPAKLKPPTATMIAKASAQVKTDSTREGLKKPANKDVPVNVKGGGRTGISVNLPPQMADAPTIRSLIYGSRTVMKKRA